MSNEISSKDEILKQVKSKVDLGNIKSNYMLKILFNCMKKNISLIIVKYNKKLQKRLNLNINSYKDYSQLYSPIEIEIKKFGKINMINIIYLNNVIKKICLLIN